MRTLLDLKKIELYYQPIVCSKTEDIHMYEGLARLEMYGRMLVPCDFIPIAKNCNMYNKITENVLNQALISLTLYSDISISINVSIDDLYCQTTRAKILALSKKYPDEISRLTLEVLETEENTKPTLYKKAIIELKKANVKIAIDDFGTGFSNMASLLSVHVDYVKIAGEIISEIHREKTQELVRLLVSYCKKYNIKTIAEKIETQESATLLRGLGVDYLQGYHFQRPLPYISLKDDEKVVSNA
jgi:c-di-GMP phosphodiesterase